MCRGLFGFEARPPCVNVLTEVLEPKWGVDLQRNEAVTGKMMKPLFFSPSFCPVTNIGMPEDEPKCLRATVDDCRGSLHGTFEKRTPRKSSSISDMQQVAQVISGRGSATRVVEVPGAGRLLDLFSFFLYFLLPHFLIPG